MWTALFLFPFIIIASADKLCAYNSRCSTVEDSTLQTTSYEPSTSFTLDYNDQGTQSRKLFAKINDTYIPKDKETDKNQVIDVDEDTLTGRNRRSQPGFIRFLKRLFVKPINNTDSQDNPDKNTLSTDVRTSQLNIAKDEAYRDKDGGRERGTIYILYKLNETLEKLVKTLTMLMQRNIQDYAVIDIPVLLQRTKREVGPLSVIKLENVTNANVTVNKSDSNKNNETKSLDEVEQGTNSVGNVSRRFFLDVTKYPYSDVNKASNPDENVAGSQINNVTDQETSDSAVNIYKTSNRLENVTDKSNMTESRKTWTNVINRSDLLIKSALKHIQEQISDIKTLKVVSDESFKIGYIVSSLETLELTIKKIMNRMTLSIDTEWARKISDKIELSKKVVSNLMKYLRMHPNWQ